MAEHFATLTDPLTGASYRFVKPPNRIFRRARRWETFQRLFEPLERVDGSVLWESSDVPKDTDYRHWWTVLDPMTTGQLYLAAGFHFVNRLGYVQCKHAWSGDWQHHPEYLYEPAKAHPVKPTISCTIRITLDAEDGSLAPDEVRHAQADLEDALQTRLFGEGFLPDHINVADYTITSTKQ